MRGGRPTFVHASNPSLDRLNRVPEHNDPCLEKTVTRRFVTQRLLLLLLWAAAPLLGLQAQPVSFGSADDPREELQAVWWRRENTLDAMGGLSLISDQWRAAASLGANLVTKSVTARLAGTVRGGIYGDYGPDVNEWYDALRLVEFARYTPPRRSTFYLRAGLIERMRLGSGHLVNFYNSHVAWDDRTVGLETMASGAFLDVAGFTDNVLVNGVTGGRVAVRPFAATKDLRTRTFEMGFNYVTDFSTRTREHEGLTGYNVDMKFNVLASGTIHLVPFASFAWYPEYGSGLSFGADIESPNFIDLARFRLRMALYYNGPSFIPGYVGSFYGVRNPNARIVNSTAYLVRPREVRYEGASLAESFGGTDLETEFRLLLFEQFELWYYFRRHYGAQHLSEYHLRAFLHVRNQLRLDAGIDRGGLLGFGTLFNDLGDQTALVFGVDYRFMGPFWAFIRSRYTYERVGTHDDGTALYLVQRRFEPLAGMRFAF